MARLLIGDGDENVRRSLEHTLSPLVAHVALAADAETALSELLDPRIEVAVVDLFSAGFGGVSFMAAMRSAGCRADVIVITEQATAQNAVAALKSGAREFLGKPLDSSTVVRAVEGLIRLRPNPRYWAERLRRFVADNCDLPSLCLGTVSERFGISTSYTSRLFRDEIGTTFRKHLASCRIQEAKRQLVASDLPVYLVAEICGFSSQCRLAETFRRLEGISPRAYRIQHLE